MRDINRYKIMPLFFILALTSCKIRTIENEIAWYEKLPDCPCKNPDIDGVKLNDGWAKDKGNLEKYHEGATESFRSYPPTRTKYGKSSQQCCYDGNGNLIKSGKAAGTPDKISACRGENKKGVMKFRVFGVIGHILKDVYPWKHYMKKDSLGWKSYNLKWSPNKGNNCNSINE